MDKSDPKKDPEFRKTVKRLLETPPKPRKKPTVKVPGKKSAAPVTNSKG